MSAVIHWLLSPTVLAVSRQVLLYATTLFGALAVHAFHQYRNFDGATTFLMQVLPNHTPVFYSRANLIVVVLSGSIIGSIVFQPTQMLQALTAGFTWTAAMQTIVAGGRNV